MSSGSTHHRRKPDVAASTLQLFKASNRSANGQPAGAGSGTKSSSAMKRQRQSESGALDAESSSSQSNAKPSKKRFVGVRQRPSGRWVAEIKDTTQKIRLWLGTFDSAEEGAKAYDSAARALRGANTRTNFVAAMVCDGASAPGSKAARLIRLRQMAAAAKVTKSGSQGADHSIPKIESPEVIDSPAMVRLDKQQSIRSSTSSLEPLIPSPPSDHAPPLYAAASPPKPPPRLVDRRHNVLAYPQPDWQDEDHEDVALPLAAIHDHGLVDNGSPKADVIPPKLEPHQSVTSEGLSDASGSPPLNFPSSRSHFKPVRSVNSLVVSLENLQHKERLAMEPSFTVEASRSSFSHHHPLSSCASDGDQVDVNPSEANCAPDMDTGETSAFILREDFTEMDQVPNIPWSKYTRESGMLPGLDESSGVYTSAFDFSAEAIDRDSCTSIMVDHVEHDPLDEFLMHYEQTPSHEVDHDQCVLLTQPLDRISSSCQPHHIWRSMDVNACWDGQSSGSTEEVQVSGGECMSSQQQDPDICDVGDHDVWSSMDLPPLCMVP